MRNSAPWYPGITPRSAMVPSLDDWLLFKLHEAPANDTDIVNSSGKVLDDPLTLENGASGDWVAGGWLQPGGGSGSAATYARDLTETMRAFFDMTTMSGGLLIAFWAHVTDRTPGANEFWWSHSLSGSTAGGYGFRLLTNSTLEFVFRAEGSGTDAQRGTKVLTDTQQGADVSYVYYLDAANGTISGYWNGEEQSLGSATIPTPLPKCATTAADGLCLFGRSAVSPSLLMNGNAAGSNTKISDLMFARLTAAQGAQVAKFAAQHAQHRGDLPLVFLRDF